MMPLLSTCEAIRKTWPPDGVVMLVEDREVTVFKAVKTAGLHTQQFDDRFAMIFRRRVVYFGSITSRNDKYFSGISKFSQLNQQLFARSFV